MTDDIETGTDPIPPDEGPGGEAPEGGTDDAADEAEVEPEEEA